MKNPFYLTELSETAPFCDREKELRELTSHAVNSANVVLYSPRRYGKTSLARRVQAELAHDGTIPVYIDFFGVDSVETVCQKIVTALYSHYSKDMAVLRKVARVLSSWRPQITVKPDPETGFTISAEPTIRTGGLDLLEETLSQFGGFARVQKKGFHIIFDEFQEITQLPDSLKIEGVLRSHIQRHTNVSYFFVGSRRRLLIDMFNADRRPFYKSAINYPLAPLPREEAEAFIVDRFAAGKKKCPRKVAAEIYGLVAGYPYYIQRIPYSIYEVTEGKDVRRQDLSAGVTQVYDQEKPAYESYLRAIAPVQIRLVTALAQDPTVSPYSIEYMARHGLGSIGGVQGALNKLLTLDYIEKDNNGAYRVVDPVFALWLKRSTGVTIEAAPDEEQQEMADRPEDAPGL